MQTAQGASVTCHQAKPTKPQGDALHAPHRAENIKLPKGRGGCSQTAPGSPEGTGPSHRTRAGHSRGRKTYDREEAVGAGGWLCR